MIDRLDEQLDGETVELGFYYPLHMDTVATKGRAVTQRKLSGL